MFAGKKSRGVYEWLTDEWACPYWKKGGYFVSITIDV
jgi:hypothetical protein